MPILVWSDDLDTRIPELDAQHRVMLDHVNRLHAAADSGSPHDRLEAMDALIECLRQHFVFEEKVLQMIDFQGLDAHRGIHHEMLQELLNCRKRLETGSDADAAEIIDGLGPWLVNHVRHDDFDFGPTVREWLRDAAPPDDPFRQLVGDT